jgi:hypothetical protein
MIVNNIDPILNSLNGKFIVCKPVNEPYPLENLAVSTSESGAITLLGSYEDNKVEFYTFGRSESKLTDVINEIESHFTFSTVYDSKFPVYQITGIKELTFYNYTEEMPKYDPYHVKFCKYPKNKEQTTPESMFYHLCFDVVKV